MMRLSAIMSLCDFSKISVNLSLGEINLQQLIMGGEGLWKRL